MAKSYPTTKQQAMKIIAEELDFAFGDAEEYQGCKAPYEIDSNRAHLQTVHRDLLKALSKLPERALTELGRRLHESEGVRAHSVATLEEEYRKE